MKRILALILPMVLCLCLLKLVIDISRAVGAPIEKILFLMNEKKPDAMTQSCE